MQLLAGTSGFSYKEWLGKFYPEKLPMNEMLAYYARHFATVEINNTFYRMPGESMLDGWCRQVPDGFSFTLKAPRRITHDKRLREVESDVTEFVRRAQALASRLGVLLFQLPPNFKKDLDRLRNLLSLLPGDRCFAFEFRNASWHDEEVYAVLREDGAMLCVTDTDEGDTPFVTTSRHGYLRLRRTHYSDDELRAWADRIAGQRLERAYVYFMHEDDAMGTKFAQRLLELWRARTA
jgi:uncharacterized protein YecE (DUF72 family)